MNDTTERTRETVVQATRPILIALSLAALLVDPQLALGLLVFGIIGGEFFVAVLFDAAVLVGRWWSSRQTNEWLEQDPVTVLKNRYAQGELTDEEFDRKLNRLRETN